MFRFILNRTTRNSPLLLARCFTNYRRTDCVGFQHETEAAFDQSLPPASRQIGERTFRDILLSAANHIPGMLNIRLYSTHSTQSSHPHSQRGALRDVASRDPGLKSSIVAEIIRVASRRAWTETVDVCDHQTHSSWFWSLLMSLSGKRARSDPNQSSNFSRE